MKYFFFLTPEYRINASVKENTSGIYINTVDCKDSIEMLGTIEILQNAVDATLLLLDENRKLIEKQTSGELN